MKLHMTVAKACIVEKAFLEGWELFAANPCRETAATWLNRSPDRLFIFEYFRECCPGGGFAKANEYFSERGLG